MFPKKNRQHIFGVVIAHASRVIIRLDKLFCEKYHHRINTARVVVWETLGGGGGEGK